jgi:hypothetical protein
MNTIYHSTRLSHRQILPQNTLQLITTAVSYWYEENTVMTAHNGKQYTSLAPLQNAYHNTEHLTLLHSTASDVSRK